MLGILIMSCLVELLRIVAGKDLRVVNDLLNELCRFFLGC